MCSFVILSSVIIVSCKREREREREGEKVSDRDGRGEKERQSVKENQKEERERVREVGLVIYKKLVAGVLLLFSALSFVCCTSQAEQDRRGKSGK